MFVVIVPAQGLYMFEINIVHVSEQCFSSCVTIQHGKELVEPRVAEKVK